MKHPVHVIDAPSNLGLRPPAEGVVPGVYKLAGALRDQGLVGRLGAIDGGVVTPPRYQTLFNADLGIRNGASLASYSRALADRLSKLPDGFQLVLGGDCSILLGICLNLSRAGRYGLVFMDAHSDFRHPGNFPPIVAAAGEDLAILSGRGDAGLIDLGGNGALLDLEDVVLVGVRPSDPALPELSDLGADIIDSAVLVGMTPQSAAKRIVGQMASRGVEGFWIHMDADVIDGMEMPAVDCPEPDGPSLCYMKALLEELVAVRGCLGMDITIYDPDLDTDGQCAAALADVIVDAVMSGQSDEALSAVRWSGQNDSSDRRRAAGSDGPASADHPSVA